MSRKGKVEVGVAHVMALRVQRSLRTVRAASNWCLDGPLGAITCTRESSRVRSSSADHCGAMVGVFGGELGIVEDGRFGCYCGIVVSCRELGVV
jgi:hypothetical protein